MNINSNMRWTGKRHPIITNYKVGFMKDGSIVALQLDSYTDAGCSPQDSDGVTGVLNTTFPNAYNMPNFKATAKLCKTNTVSNTYTRGPGWVPAVFISEHILEHIAATLNAPADIVKRKNFFKINDLTPDGTTRLKYWNLDQIWDQLKVSADYENRKAAVDAFNSQNKWRKKGISIVPCKFGVAWQGVHHAAVVNIYPDGSVVVTHSGVEIGQGIHTKIAQATAYELGIPLSYISVTTTSTLSTPNTQATGGSVTSALCSKAVLMACSVLNQRLAPYKHLLNNASWPQIVQTALSQGAQLTATGDLFPGPGPISTSLQYNSYSAICVQADVDILTGNVNIERADILYDAGVTLNAAIDLGQVTGAFMMGLGYYLTEEILYTEPGRLINDGTWEYKPPSIKDIPVDLRVSLLKNAPNPIGILSSKCVGEPPLALSAACFFAAKYAVQASRTERGNPGYFPLNAPATVDNLQQSASIDISQLNIK
eukprot:TRINITY_DN7426_c0_g1_i1.p1 TRINITY_DN7426_c0_g1~~TRINITY_DN7426_c0_g1_i1.p1  ORF type:complete len:483 (+),score=92.27 TRINITY_DN7426_c0_g1_i1:338-1786(+)